MPGKKKSDIQSFFKKRVKRLRQMIRKSKIDGFFATNLSCVRYLCGFSGTTGYLLVLPRKTIFITDNRYREQAALEVVCDEILILTQYSLNTVLDQLTKDFQITRLGVESKGMNHWQFMTLKEAVGKHCKLMACVDWVEMLRFEKDELELKLMRKAARIGDSAFKKVLGLIREGMTELDLYYALRNATEEFGGGKMSFDAIVLFGPRSSIIHGQPSKAKLKKGQLILMDFGTTYQGYCSDMTRTVAFGDPGKEIRKAYQAVQQAQRKAALAVKAGRHTAKIDAIARGTLTEAGYGDLFLHSTGHSLGLDIHEDPRLSEQSTTVLKENMVVTVEPGIYLPGEFGIRIEDMVCATQDGPDILTRSKRNLIVV